MIKRLSLFLVCFILLSTFAWADKTVTITITDSVNPPGTSHYCYHRMKGGTFVSTDRKDAGSSLTVAWLLVSPIALGTHEFSCTAYVNDGGTQLESGFSNIQQWTNPPAAPTITVTVAQITSSGATLYAKTSDPATTTIKYWSGFFGWLFPKVITVDRMPDTEHQISLNGLRPKTIYQYVWTAAIQGKKLSYSGNFRTL